MNKRIERDFYIGIPLMFLLGTLFHYTFEWLNSFFLLAPFFPTNESIWEHTKLAFIPLIIFYVVYYFVFKDKLKLEKNRFFESCLVAVVSSIIFMIIFYYTYTGVLGKNYTFLNIFSLFLSLLVGQLISLHFYNKDREAIPLICSLSSLIILFVFYVFTSYLPIKIPLFFDFSKGMYGFK